MDHFNYQPDGRLFAENVPVEDIANNFGTPCYVYSRATLERHWKAFDEAAGDHPHLVCYAVKANSNLAILSVLAKLGSGFDIVSGGELARVIEAGGDTSKVVFSGVGKTSEEIEFALDAGVGCFNVESEPELHRIANVAGRLGKVANISIRVNPDVDAGTHPYISTGLKENKFGIAIEHAPAVYQQAMAYDQLKIVGVDCHIGSQLTELDPFLDALERVLALIDQLAELGIEIEHLDVGGGLGVPYKDETPPHPSEYAHALRQRLIDRPNLKLIFEPGRAIAANAGILLTKVEFLKPTEEKHFAIVDAAMNDLIRPSLYSAYQSIQPANTSLDRKSDIYDVVGPVCETGDFLGKDRELAIAEGDLLVVRSAGAYGFCMASNYNSRPRPPEVLVDSDNAIEVRRRETFADLWKGEVVLP
ncbi:diaminopimelate decarboxylase [Echinimonas agarilytica]|uniref:Diaminopimelate decarboxylase n=1 Tax=Echinimonas agarilytica TaxID=1215918 RepID=A0AA41W3P2_9GAMM|nr:diaminopimelate decarboxylase [Echinimonas agarilytica]MCM2678257.1 diaminopimelate decarboxylase [Echinimonas agarilytica]